MGIVLMRIFFNGWALIAFLFIINSVSHALFTPEVFKVWTIGILKSIWFSLIWPLSICSPEGRKILFGKFNQL